MVSETANIETIEIKEIGLCTGELLKRAILNTNEVRECYINSLIPKLSIIQFYAPDGVGKSTILTQIAVEATSGGMVLGGFPCLRPLRVLYIPLERPKEETYERIKLMMNHCNINFDNLAVQEMLGYDILNYTQRELFIKTALEYCGQFKPDILFLDPIYAMISGDVDNKSAGPINSILLRIQAEARITIVYTHHANRGTRNRETGKRENEDMYGGRFISAKCTGIFKIQQTESGTVLTKEKDSYGSLAGKITLKFDKESYLSRMDENQTMQSGNARMRAFANRCLKDKKDFNFDQLIAESNLSSSPVRDFIGVEVKKGSIINLKPSGVKALYRVIREV